VLRPHATRFHFVGYGNYAPCSHGDHPNGSFSPEVPQVRFQSPPLTFAEAPTAPRRQPENPIADDEPATIAKAGSRVELTWRYNPKYERTPYRVHFTTPTVARVAPAVESGGSMADTILADLME